MEAAGFTRRFYLYTMAIVRVIIWDEANFLQRISTPEDTFLIESIDASGSDDNILKIAPLTASSVIVGRLNVSTFVSGVLSGNFITGTFYGDGSQLRGLVTTLNQFTGSVQLVAGSNVTITSGSGQIIISDATSASINAGISASEHRALDQLVHNIAETSFEEFIYNISNHVLTGTIWTNSSKITKVREERYTYTPSFLVTSSLIIQYDVTGSEAERLTEVYKYVSGTVIENVQRSLIIL